MKSENRSEMETEQRRDQVKVHKKSHSNEIRRRAMREQLGGFRGLSPESGRSQGQNLALTVLFVPDSLDSSREARAAEFVFVY